MRVVTHDSSIVQTPSRAVVHVVRSAAHETSIVVGRPSHGSEIILPSGHVVVALPTKPQSHVRVDSMAESLRAKTASAASFASITTDALILSAERRRRPAVGERADAHDP